MLLLGTSPAKAHIWYSNLEMSQTVDQESFSLSFAWTPAPPSCEGPSFNHYRLCLNEGSTPPATPAGADFCKIMTSRTLETTTIQTHRASRAYASSLFACSDAYCDDWYGDGTVPACEVKNSTGTQATAPECFVVQGVDDFDSDVRQSEYTGVSAVEVVVYPSGWTEANKVGLWWGWSGHGRRWLSYMRTEDAGAQNFNLADWEAETTVLVGTEDEEDEFCNLSHPLVVPELDSSNRRMRLFTPMGPCDDPGDRHLVWLQSVDEEGTDFDISCEFDEWEVETECDWEDPAVSYVIDHEAAGLSNEQHPTLLWDRIFNGPVDFGADDPVMLISGNPTTSCWTRYYDTLEGESLEYGQQGPADLYALTWDHGYSEWAAFTDLGDPECPLPEFIDQHDPTSFGLPFDEHKVYMQSALLGDDQKILIRYGEPDNWEPVAGDVVFCLDTGNDPCRTVEEEEGDCVRIEHHCVEDVRHYQFGSPHVEGLFFLAHHEGHYWYDMPEEEDRLICYPGEAMEDNRGILSAVRDN